MRRASPLLAVLLVLACSKSGDDAAVAQAGTPADPAATRTAIESQLGKFRDAMLKRDTATLGTFYHPDAIVLPAGMPMARGPAVIKQTFGGMFASASVTKFDYQIQDVTIAGDYVIETGTYSMTLQPKTGKAIDDVGKSVAVWKKDTDGSWKMYRDIFNSDKPGM